MITVEKLTRKFDQVTAVEGLTFTVQDGEVFGILGPNGAGKTTTVRMLCCLISKTSGDAAIDACHIGNARDSLPIRKRIGLVPDNVGLYEELTAYENLDFYGRLYETPAGRRRENIGRFLKMLDLWDRKDARAGTFSKGMKQKLALARALIHEPDVLFLDEPTANLDPESSKTVRDFILEIKRQGRTIILNTHNLDEAQRICDRIAILKTRLLSTGTPEQLRESASGPRTEIRLTRATEGMVQELRKRIPNRVEAEGSTLTIDVAEPEKENPGIISAIVSVGGQVLEVRQMVPTLEEVYLREVREAK